MDIISRALETGDHAASHQMPATRADHHPPSTSAIVVKTMATTDSEGLSVVTLYLIPRITFLTPSGSLRLSELAMTSTEVLCHGTTVDKTHKVMCISD